MKTSRLRPMSKNRQKVNRQRAKAMIEHFGPKDEWHCQFRHYGYIDVGPGAAVICHGEVNGHEILKRSRAGSTDENLLDMSGIVLLCGYHNFWVEDNPSEAHEMGLSKHAWES